MIKAPFKRYSLQIGTLCIIFISVLFSGCTAKGKNLTILFAGDLMLDRGTRDNIEVRGTDNLFGSVHDVISSADFTIANLECVACDTTCTPVDKKFTFRSDPEWLSSLVKNGITHLILANNHSFDFGERGIKQTVLNLKQVGIKPIGFSQNHDATSAPTILIRGNDSVAIFSSCLLKQNNRFISSGNISDLSEEIRAFKTKHPSCSLLVCLHWGVEMDTRPKPEQVEQAHQLINAGADVLIGHHPHVVQPIEVYRGKYIIYSIGNFIFDNHHSPANRGILAKLSLSKGRVVSLELVPFNIIKSKPCIMNQIDSENFRKEISLVSKTVEITQYNGNWKVF